MDVVKEIPALDGQVISRTIPIVTGVENVLFRIATPFIHWRLVVALTDGSGGARVNINNEGYDNSYSTSFFVAPKGVQAFVGEGSAVITVRAVRLSCTVSAELTPPTYYQNVWSTESQFKTVNTWTDIGDNGGFPPAQTNYMFLWADGNFDIRMVDINGTVIATYTNLTPSELLMDGAMIPVGTRFKYQIQPTGGAGNLRYAVSFYNKR